MRAKNIAPTSAAKATSATPTPIPAFAPELNPPLLELDADPGETGPEVCVCEEKGVDVDNEVEPEVMVGVPFGIDAREDVGVPVTVVLPRLNVAVKLAGAGPLKISLP